MNHESWDFCLDHNGVMSARFTLPSETTKNQGEIHETWCLDVGGQAAVDRDHRRGKRR